MKNILTLFTFIVFLSCTAAYQESNPFKEKFLKQINELRQSGCKCGSTYMPPVAPVIWNNQLELAAFAHASDMAKNNYFSHESKDGRQLRDRVFKVGYNYSGYQSFAIGENIAWGQRSIDEVMKGWIKSENHCKNLMSSNFKEVGIAERNSYWVQDFGGRKPFTKQRKNTR
jgi:uncharacterized protein YkwD